TPPNPLNVSAIIDESVLHRVVGGKDIMRDQWRRLIDASQLPNVDLQILPFDAGEHPFLGGPVALLEVPGAAQMDIVYLEGLAGDLYEEQPSEVARYRDEFERLSAKTLDRHASVNVIQSLLDR